MSGHYRFDWIMDRRNTNSVKWDTMDEKYYGEDTIHLGAIDMDFQSPRAVRQSVFDILDLGVFGCTNISETFYESIQRWYYKRQKVKVKKEWIVHCPTIEMSAGISVQTYTEEGDGVIVITPSDRLLEDAVINNDRKIIRCPVVKESQVFTIDFESIRNQIDSNTKMMMLSSPHVPTGRVWSREELVKISEFCEMYDLILYVDGSYSDLIRSSEEYISMLDFDVRLNRRIIFAATPAKVFSIKGTIISFMIIPDGDLRWEMESGMSGLGVQYASLFGTVALEQAYQNCDDWYEELKTYLDQNEKKTREFFAAYLPGMRVGKRESTSLLWISYEELGISETGMEKWLVEEANVSVSMGTEFGPEGIGYFALNIGTSKYRLEQAFGRMERAYTKLFNL